MKVKIRGKRKLEGTVHISGAKNSAVAIIPAAILADEDVIIRNIPNIDDVATLISIMKEMGYIIHFDNNILIIKAKKRVSYNVQSELVKRLRGSYYFMGALLGKIKKVKINNSGGCNLGSRPINYHLDNFQKLGAKLLLNDEEVYLKATKLKGTSIDLEFPSVGATINTMLAAVKASGITIINNAAIEPEIVDVGNFLVSMGAIVEGLGTPIIKITGVKRLHSTDYTIISDRIEAGTYLILGAMSNGNGVRVKNINPTFLISLTNLLEEIGCTVKIYENEIFIKREEQLKPFKVITKPYPGFPTDLGQPLSALMLTIEGTSIIKETIFSNRFSHINELKKMGANIEIVDNEIQITGTPNLHSAKLTAYDLRGAAALILGATLNKGITQIDNIETLLRGYEYPIEKLQKLGLNIILES
ncbi:MAG: UDP-N-acetylglucosamine 1-carboxyvinyltransferase [Bacilli bacterium]|nr:UDP-N-acetylglucosamine 1-carboxyvinyltransferase [Bacilli bacterium]